MTNEESSCNLPRDPPGNDLSHKSLFTVASVATGRLISLLLQVVLVRVIPLAEIGLLQLITWFMGALVPLLTFGLVEATQKHLAEFAAAGADARINGWITKVLKLSLVLLVAGIGVCMALSVQIAVAFLGSSAYVPLVLLACAVIFFQSLNSLFCGILQGVNRIEPVALLDLVAKRVLLALTVFVLTCFWIWGIWGVLVGNLIAFASSSCVALVLVARHMVRSKQSSAVKPTNHQVMAYSAPHLLRRAVQSATQLLFALLAFGVLGAHRGLGAEPAAIFGLMMKVELMAYVLVQAVGAPLVHALVGCVKVDPERAQRMFQLTHKLVMMGGILMGLVLAVAGRSIILVLFGTPYLPGHLVLVVLSVELVLLCWQATPHAALMSADDSRPFLHAMSAKAVLLLPSVLLLLPFGVIGIALACVLGALASGVVVRRAVHGNTVFRDSWRDLGKLGAAVGTCVAAWLLLQSFFAFQFGDVVFAVLLAGLFLLATSALRLFGSDEFPALRRNLPRAVRWVVVPFRH